MNPDNVLELRDQYRSGEQRPMVVLVDPAELELLREQARLAAVLVIAVYDRRRRGWHKTPMRFVDQLAAALLKGRAW